jgi:hypothetical protein
MASKTFGSNAHHFGVDGTVTNATVNSFTDTVSHGNESEQFDENGNSIERRYDDVTNEVEIDFTIYETHVDLTIGSTIVYNSVTYEITGITKSQQNRDFTRHTVSAKKSEYITYS